MFLGSLALFPTHRTSTLWYCLTEFSAVVGGAADPVPLRDRRHDNRLEAGVT
jgi:hypothetical protein